MRTKGEQTARERDIVTVHPGLTRKQLDILAWLALNGYFEEPRETDQTAAASYFGIHPGALSIQYRRGLGKLVRAYVEAIQGQEVPAAWRDPTEADLDRVAERVGVIRHEQRRFGGGAR